MPELAESYDFSDPQNPTVAAGGTLEVLDVLGVDGKNPASREVPDPGAQGFSPHHRENVPDRPDSVASGTATGAS